MGDYSQSTRWAHIVDPPPTATRWPTWGEIRDEYGRLPIDLISAPDGFPPEQHDHDERYLKLSGGALSGNLRIINDAVFPNVSIEESTPADVAIHTYFPRGISISSIGNQHGGYDAGWPVYRGTVLNVVQTDQRNFQLLRGRAESDATLEARRYPSRYLYHRACASDQGCDPWMRIVSEDPQGNVGVGTTNPAEKLHVVGTGRFTDTVRVKSVATNTGRLRGDEPLFLSNYPRGISYTPSYNGQNGTEDTSDSWPDLNAPGVALTVIHGGSRNFQLYREKPRPGGERHGLWHRACAEDNDQHCDGWSRILSEHPETGYVGVGKLNPAQKLHVAGNVLANNHLTTSDGRLKEDIVPLSNVLPKLSVLRGVSYLWKNGERDKRDIGLIAQEVAESFPEAVIENKDDGYLSVDYGRLVAPLISAVNDLNKEKSDMQRLLKKQEKDIKSLKAQIDKLKQFIHEL